MREHRRPSSSWPSRTWCPSTRFQTLITNVRITIVPPSAGPAPRAALGSRPKASPLNGLHDVLELRPLAVVHLDEHVLRMQCLLGYSLGGDERSANPSGLLGIPGDL